MAFRYENVAKVGDRVRSYDFRDKDNCFVEGVVTEKNTNGKYSYACFVITVDCDCWEGKVTKSKGRVGQPTYVPMQLAYGEYDRRVVNVGK